MSAFEDKLTFLLAEAIKLGINVHEDLLAKVAKGIGPNLYSVDASLVATSDKEEMKRLKESFIIGKLGITDNQAIDEALEEVTAQFGVGNRNKHRALFYYLLVVKFGKSSIYKD